MIFIELLCSFLMIGLFSFGGGYGMLSVIQGEVVTRHAWLTAAEFTDIVAVSQMTPGPIGINSATYVGYTAVLNATGSEALAVLGSLTASLAVMLPSIVLMLIVSRFFMKYSKHRNVENVFRLLRPAVVGLIASAALLLMNKENFGDTDYEMIASIAICVVSFCTVYFTKIHPILVIVLAGIAGYMIY